MPYDSLITRSDAQALVPEEVSNQLLQGVPGSSAALTLFPRVPLSRNQARFPVLATLPQAYWVDGDTGLKQTTEQSWANKFITVEELACIVPIPEAVLDDAGFDVWGSIRPNLEQAMGRVIDEAIFFGTNKPASWPADIITAATAAGNTFTRGTETGGGGISSDISNLFTTVEADGYDVSGVIANRIYRGLLRNARNAQGDLHAEVGPNTAYGVGITYPMRGMWATGLSAPEMIVGDFSNGIFGLRQDFTYKILDQAVITDPAGLVIYNLAQQDMVALRLVMRVGFQVANLMNFDQPVEANRYPFGVMLAPAGP